ncbi:671_t:CDS:2 [Entrophospora sp. SA101]|nr:671_t:CDS:2 [Entrophospora sp. SA101]
MIAFSLTFIFNHFITLSFQLLLPWPSPFTYHYYQSLNNSEWKIIGTEWNNKFVANNNSTTTNLENAITTTSTSSSISNASYYRRTKRSPSLNTRASRVGVTNFINIIKSLHAGEQIPYFPITEKLLEEYINAKRKSMIKSGSLEQYLQHIQAYNISLGFGWNGLIFGPIIKKALDELRTVEEEVIKTSLILQQHHNNINNDSLSSNDKEMVMMIIDDEIDEQTKSSKKFTVICLDANSNDSIQLDQQIEIYLDDMNFPKSNQTYKNFHSNVVSSTAFPTSWGNVDVKKLYYKVIRKNKKEKTLVENKTKVVDDDAKGNGIIMMIENDDSNNKDIGDKNVDESKKTTAIKKKAVASNNNDDYCNDVIIELNDEDSFNKFWKIVKNIYNETDDKEDLKGKGEGGPVNHDKNPDDNDAEDDEYECEIQLILYRKNNIPHIITLHTLLQEILLLIVIVITTPLLKSVTVRSKKKVYKQKVAVSDTTTFSSVVTFAINNASAPPNKQFVIRSADSSLEYIPNDLIREVISGVEHTDIVVSLENSQG